jgi:hypothetical protein
MFLSVIEPPPVGWLKTQESMPTGLLVVCLAGLMSSTARSSLEEKSSLPAKAEKHVLCLEVL